MIVAGETSGDLHAAKLVVALRQIAETEATFFGAAGEKMREAGVEAVVASDRLSVVGLPEIARALPMFLRVFSKLKRAAIERRPDVIVLVDFPDFNLKLAKSLGRRGFKIVYYISPQLWAWRQYRLRTIRKYVDLVISILPFEQEWYAQRGVDRVEYVGSPLAREVRSGVGRAHFRTRHGLTDDPLIALLPGSRHKEVAQILPVMLETAALMFRRDPRLQFLIASASIERRDDIDAAIAKAKRGNKSLPEKLIVVQDATFDALNASDAAAVTSGTATLETGIIGTPMAIVYKTSALNYKLLRPLIDVDHFGLINLIAGERVATELIQDQFTPTALADELFRLLSSEENEKTRQKLKIAADRLGHGGASKRAAEAILTLLKDSAS
jgi:lipid-A-disaccharide synthase